MAQCQTNADKQPERRKKVQIQKRSNKTTVVITINREHAPTVRTIVSPPLLAALIATSAAIELRITRRTIIHMLDFLPPRFTQETGGRAFTRPHADRFYPIPTDLPH